MLFKMADKKSPIQLFAHTLINLLISQISEAIVTVVSIQRSLFYRTEIAGLKSGYPRCCIDTAPWISRFHSKSGAGLGRVIMHVN